MLWCIDGESPPRGDFLNQANRTMGPLFFIVRPLAKWCFGSGKAKLTAITHSNCYCVFCFEHHIEDILVCFYMHAQHMACHLFACTFRHFYFHAHTQHKTMCLLLSTCNELLLLLFPCLLLPLVFLALLSFILPSFISFGSNYTSALLSFSLHTHTLFLSTISLSCCPPSLSPLCLLHSIKLKKRQQQRWGGMPSTWPVISLFVKFNHL